MLIKYFSVLSFIYRTLSAVHHVHVFFWLPYLAAGVPISLYRYPSSTYVENDMSDCTAAIESFKERISLIHIINLFK